jgi:hypothetical protein
VKKRLNHIGSVLAITPIIFTIEWALYVFAGSKSRPKEHMKFIWDAMWEPIDESECNINLDAD